MEITPQFTELVAALSKAQAAMTNAPKDSLNPHFRSNYADLASVINAIRKPFTDNGLSWSQFVRTQERGVEVETIVFHSSGQFMKETLFVPTPKFDAQGLGSAQTYGRRYALQAMAGLAGEDDDGNAATASANGRGAASGAAEPITAEQVETLRAAIVEVAADLPRFLLVFAIKRLEEMPAGRYPEAIHMLDRKREQSMREEGSDA